MLHWRTRRISRAGLRSRQNRAVFREGSGKVLAGTFEIALRSSELPGNALAKHVFNKRSGPSSKTKTRLWFKRWNFVRPHSGQAGSDAEPFSLPSTASAFLKLLYCAQPRVLSRHLFGQREACDLLAIELQYTYQYGPASFRYPKF